MEKLDYSYASNVFSILAAISLITGIYFKTGFSIALGILIGIVCIIISERSRHKSEQLNKQEMLEEVIKYLGERDEKTVSIQTGRRSKSKKV